MTHPVQGLLDIVWAIVLLQGGFLILLTIESLVANAVQGFALIGITIITGLAATMTLVAARGIRRHRRWARRVTMVGEWFLLVFGVIELLATQMIDPSGADLIPLVTGIILPVSVLVMLRRSRKVFGPEIEAAV